MSDQPRHTHRPPVPPRVAGPLDEARELGLTGALCVLVLAGTWWALGLHALATGPEPAQAAAAAADTVPPRVEALRRSSALYDCLTTVEPGLRIELAFRECGLEWPRAASGPGARE